MYIKYIANINRWILSLLMLSIVLIGKSMVNTYKDTPYDNITVLIFMIFVILYHFGWLYLVGEYLHPKVAMESNLSINNFRKSITAIILYLLISILIRPFHWEKVESVLLFIGGPIIMFFNFYTAYFVAKSIVVAEQGKKFNIENVAKKLALICFLPLGILLLQPAISKLKIKN